MHATQWQDGIDELQHQAPAMPPRTMLEYSGTGNNSGGLAPCGSLALPSSKQSLSRIGVHGQSLPSGACSGMLLSGERDEIGKRQAARNQTVPIKQDAMPPRAVPEHVLAQAMLQSISGVGGGHARPFVDPYVPASAMSDFTGTRPIQVSSGTGSIIPVSLSNDLYVDAPHASGSDCSITPARMQTGNRSGPIDHSLSSVLGAAPPPPTPSSALAIEPPPGLGASHPPTGMDVPDTSQQQQVASLRRQVLRQAIVRFYYEHRPEKLQELNFVDALCSMYEGREAELDDALKQKYGSGLHPPGLSDPGLVCNKSRPSATLVQPVVVPDGGALRDEPMFVGQSSSWQQAKPASPLDTGVPMPSLAAPHMLAEQPTETDNVPSDAAPDVQPAGAPEPKAGQALLDELDRYQTDLDLDEISGEGVFEIPEEVAQAIISKVAIQDRRRLLEDAIM